MAADAASHVVADQSEAIGFLADPASHGIEEPVVRFDTHGAVVFLAGEDAYKLKRAVRFPFMDLSSVDRRRAACEAEITVNRANAPSIYLGALPITRGAGGLRLGGEGSAVDWVVHMRRFDPELTLDHVAAAGGLTPELLARLARAVLASHERAPVREGAVAVDGLARYIGQNDEALRAVPELFPLESVAKLTDRSRALLAAHRDLLLERGAAGFVRRCHGDLHLRNLVLLDGAPVLFDAIEFDEAIATCDLLYDLAFLLMDLRARGLSAEANAVFNRYLWGSDERHLGALGALPLFLSLRAALRAKLVAAEAQVAGAGQRSAREADARRYFDLAVDFVAPAAPSLVAVGGLSGTGKSTLAAALAPDLGRAPGAVHLRSDIERKRLFGVEETERLPAATYTPETSARIYAELERKAGLALGAGHAVVVDAVSARADERSALAEITRRCGVPFRGLWLEAPALTLERRVSERRGDASDADAAVVRQQLGYELGAIDWTRIDASGMPADVLARARTALTAQ